MAAKESKKEEDEEEKTQDEMTWHEKWYQNNFAIGFVIGIGIYISYAFLKIIDLNIMLMGMLVLAMFFFVFPSITQLSHLGKSRTTPYIDFNPVIDVPLVEKALFDTGRRIVVRRWAGEPKFGDGSIAPRNIHFKAIEELPSGIKLPVQFSMGVLKRNITNFNDNYSRIEAGDLDWSGSKKYDGEVSLRPIYVPRAAFYRPSMTKEEIKDEKTKEEEEEE